MMICLVLGTSQAQAEVKKSSFFDWNYAVSVWSDFKTLDALNAEWAKYEKPTEKWQEQYAQAPDQALEELKTNPQADLIKKGYDLSLVFDFWAAPYQQRGGSDIWQVYEPNCYEGGDTYSLSSADNDYRIDDRWSRWNIFTSKCDYPDWRTESNKRYDAKQKAEFLAHVEMRRDRIDEKRRK